MKTNLLKSIFISLILVMGVNNAWAASEGSGWYDWASSENVYFDNTNSSYSNVSMLIGRQWNYGGDGVGSSGVNFTKVENTNNLYHAATTWNHYNTLLFIDAKDWGWEGDKKVTQRYSYASNYTNTNNVNINGTELFYAASSTKGATLNHQDLSGYEALNSQQTIQSAVNGAVANSKATISITSYKMTAHKTTTEQTATLGTGANVSYITAARTATTTLKVGDVETGYQFDGWYTAATGGTQLSSSTTYTYYPTAATTVYARFSTKQHTVLFDVHSSGHGSLTAKVGETSISSGNKVNYGSTIVFTATPSTGYQIEGWYSNSACTEPIDNGTNDTYTVTITGGTNVYVKFEAIPANSHNITYTAQGTGWTYGAKPTSAEEREKVIFEVFPTTGYGVTVKSDGPELGRNGNEYSFEMPGKDVAITVIAEEILSTITIVANPEKGGTLTVDGVDFASGNTVQVGVSTAKTVTANPNPGYGVNAWAVSSRDIVKASGGTTVTLTADGSGREGTLYANFGILTYDITYNLDGGTNHVDNLTNYTIETPTITLKEPTKTGYTFNGWYSEAGFTNNVTEIATGSTDNKTFYAKWTENKSTITVTTANSAQGTIKFGNTTKDWGTTASVGVTTTQNITVTANKGFKFVRWDLTGGAQSSSALTNATITLKGDGNGTAGTVTAVFEEDLSSNYVVRGGAKFGNTWNNNNNKMTKKPGYSTEDIVYFPVNIDATNTGNNADGNFQFKVYETVKGEWWGLKTDDCSNDAYWYSRSTGEQTMYQCANIDLRADVAGTYEIKVDYSNVNSPKITVIFPSSSMSLVGSFNSWNENTNPFAINGDVATATIDLPAGEYEFKINDDGTWRTMTTSPRVVTRNANKDINFNTTGGNDNNTILNADAAGTYTFVYNKSSQTLTIEYPDVNIYLVGEFNWDIDVNNKFEETSEGSGVYQLTKHFEARDRHQTTTQGQPEYEFKLRINNTNYTVEGDGNKKHLQYTRQSTSKVIDDGTAYNDPYYNLLLQADIKGDYLFTYVAATRTLTVTHPEYTPKASYLVGDFSDGVTGTDNLPKDGGQGKDWTEEYGLPITVDGNTGSVEVCKWPAGEWEFKVKINGLWYGLKDLNITQSGTYELTDDYAEMGDRNVSMITTNGECYSFTYTQNNDGTLDVLVIFGNETHAVSFNANGHGTAPATQNIHYMKTASEPTMADVDDYMFGGWYTDATCTQKYDFSTPVTEDITLYAKWIPYTQCIFFKNNLGWKDVFVYTFSNNVWYDNEDSNTKYGPGVCTKVNVLEFAKMTQVNNTDIYYYILTKQNGFNHIAFSDANMNNWDEFYGNNAIYRADRNDQLPLFIPKKSQTPTTTNKTEYYSSGIWMKYNSTESGYDWRGATSESESDSGWNTGYNFTASKPGGYTFKASVPFNNVNQHYFKIHNIVNDWFGNGGTMTQKNCTGWIFGTDNSSNAKITPTITGEYNFTIYLGDGEVSVSLDYPLSVGDYRLAYKDNTKASYHPGHYLKKHSETQTDTVSFFIHHNQEPEIFVEKCTNITDGKPTWAKVVEITNKPAASINESGVYNFFLQQVEGNTLPTLVNKAMPYTGSFYIRTDAADGGWDSFRQKSNQITYSSFADAHSNFNHYYCKYIEAGRNVKFTIANDYSYCISDTLDNDDIIKKGQSSIGCLPINANVRFGWDSNTNKISRAYIKGAGMTSDRFLVLQGQDSNLKDANGNVIPKGTGTRTGLEANEEILVDQQNWIYQVEVTANKDTKVKLIAEYNGTTQYFKGNEKEYTGLLSSTTANSYKIRLVYDFKSNNLVAAMVLDGNKEVEKDDALGTDMMVIRRNQGHAEQLTFNPDSKKLTEVGTVYAVMTFTSEWINGTAKARERSLYWVSFPFDVKVSDVFGFGEYGEEWILQYYDGAERAEKGLFGDSGTYWKYIEDTKTTLNAGTGYVLALDLSKVKFLHGATEVSLYFPSTKPLTTISGKLPTAATVPAHECTIDREWTEGGTKYHHKYTDSHWNLIGVPGFADIDFDLAKTGYHFMQNDASFYYNFKLAESTYAVEASHVTEFQAMYAYMVQFAGTINWTSSEVSGVERPELIAPRNSDAEPEKVVLRLELAQGEEEEDHTFVQLQQEGATANFDLSLDLTKIMNSGFSNIYTLTDSLKIQVAGNALPMEETVVPVGVNIAAAGEYTFRMPDGTEGMVVELIDYETNTRTNLLLSDYIVTLPKGTSENRFALHIQPQKDVVTSLENIGEGVNNGEAVNKYLIDGKLIIRTAEGVFDAQGHRL